MKAAFAVLQPFVAILMQRVGPERLPSSSILLLLVLILHWIVYSVGTHLSGAPSRDVFLLPLADMVAQCAFFVLFLLIFGLQHRVVQTLTASFGVDTLFNFFLLPIALAVGTSSAERPLPTFLVLSWLLLVIWSITVKGFILHRAAGIPHIPAVILALLFALGMFKLSTTISTGA